MAGQTAIPPAAVGTLRGGAAAGVVVAALGLITALTSLDWGKYAPAAAAIAGLVPALYGVLDQLGGQPGQSGLVAGHDVTPQPPVFGIGEPLTLAEPIQPVIDPDAWGEAVAEAIIRSIDKLASRPA